MSRYLDTLEWAHLTAFAGWCPLAALEFRIPVGTRHSVREAAEAWAGRVQILADQREDLAAAIAASALTRALIEAGACSDWAMTAGWAEAATDRDVLSYLAATGLRASAAEYAEAYRHVLPAALVERAEILLADEFEL